MHDIRENTQTLDALYGTGIYKRIKLMFAAHQIKFLEYRQVRNVLSPDFLLTKVFCSQYSEQSCLVQIPVLIRDTDIRRMQQLSLHRAFPAQNMWVQWFYQPEMNGFRICE